MIVILIRHAERESSGNDPGLTAAGKRRASLLATMFAGSGVTAIFTSGFRRTQETAAPLGQKVGLTPRQIDDNIAQAKAQVLASGQCVVVVGHSDTVPALITALGGPSNIVIGDGEFDRIFVLTVTSQASASLLSMRYASR